MTISLYTGAVYTYLVCSTEIVVCHIRTGDTVLVLTNLSYWAVFVLATGLVYTLSIYTYLECLTDFPFVDDSIAVIVLVVAGLIAQRKRIAVFATVTNPASVLTPYNLTVLRGVALYIRLFCPAEICPIE